MDRAAWELGHKSFFCNELHGRAVLHVSGSEALPFLDRILSNDLMGLSVGQGCRALLLSSKGRVEVEVIAGRLAEGLLLEADASRLEVLVQRLDLLRFTEDVDWRLLTPDYRVLAVVGPEARRALEELPGADIAALAEEDHAIMEVADGWIARWNDLGLPGFRLVLRTEATGGMLDRWTTAGAAHLTEDVREVLRVGQGRPRWGKDVDDSVIALEAGFGDAIVLTKCYPGQEVLSRIHHLGHVNRRLVGLRLDGGDLPPEGAQVLAGDGVVGQVTSAVQSPEGGEVLALGYVRRNSAEPGAVLTVDGRPARVVR